ncbi:hypothetical protein N8H74_26540 [Pseudomonas sp. B2M1-30]|uniref:hypothetical protein n=1 Tax=Pseudomonas TaxID=286 RepID=UPI0021CA61E4|nr:MULTISPECIES: hypothetical protein [Pseudomonas]MCU0121831.1 hypothetical protein [Pseudomonas sp. B2M1-30]MCU7264477.1 hypothetical protein [Pseudomonas koreensis]
MKSSILRINHLLLGLLLFSGISQSATGPEIAYLLNQRYQNTSNQCAGATPAYFCSGVLLRGSQGTGPFWKHDAQAVQLGAEGFNFLRADLDNPALTEQYGAVFSDQFTAIGENKVLDALCVYPVAFPVQATRPGFGCGWNAAARTQDVSSCKALDATQVESWLSHFAQQSHQPARQCSLSTRDPAQFLVSLIAHQRIQADQPTLVQIRNWDDQAPNQIPLQGLFYDLTQAGSLLGAQKDQRDYFEATGDWLPIIRMDLRQKPNSVFGFNQQDQLYIGYQVAAKLNARYADTAMACRGNTAAYNCNGILIRTTDASADFHAWNPSPGSVERNGVSFSYLRTDLHLPILAWAKNQGLIMKELAAPTAYPLTVRCAWPFDAATFYRSDSCNGHSGNPTASKPCDEQGITTVDEYITHFYKQSSRYHGCSLKGEQAPFAVSIEARSRLTPTDQRVHNESIIAAWPQDIPDQLPLEAFFYAAVSGKPSAQFFQRDYFQQTGRFLPIVRLTTNVARNAYVFEFDPQDQTVAGEDVRPPRIE